MHGWGKTTPAGLASWNQMSNSSTRRFPVTVTQLPVTRCEICKHTVAYRPGTLSQALADRFLQAHLEALGLSAK